LNPVYYGLGGKARVRRALPAEMFELSPSGGSMPARVKLEGIDGRAPPERVERVAQFDSTRGGHRVRTHRGLTVTTTDVAPKIVRWVVHGRSWPVG